MKEKELLEQIDGLQRDIMNMKERLQERERALESINGQLSEQNLLLSEKEEILKDQQSHMDTLIKSMQDKDIELKKVQSQAISKSESSALETKNSELTSLLTESQEKLEAYEREGQEFPMRLAGYLRAETQSSSCLFSALWIDPPLLQCNQKIPWR